MKKLVCVLLGLCMLFSAVSCGAPAGTTPEAVETTPAETTAAEKPIVDPGTPKVIVETKASTTLSGDGSFAVYVRTSDESGEYYTVYPFDFIYRNDRNVYTSNSASNMRHYRLRNIGLVRVTDFTEGGFATEEIFKLTNDGEISLAVRQNTPVDPATVTEAARSQIRADGYPGDFIGGYHGDEWYNERTLFVNDEEATLGVKKLYFTDSCSFELKTSLYAWGTSEAGSHGTEVAKHTQRFDIDLTGVTNTQSLEWLGVSTFHYKEKQVYGLMLPALRTTDNSVYGETVLNTYKAFDAKGKKLTGGVVDKIVENQYNIEFPLTTRRVEFGSDESELTGCATFDSPDGSVSILSIYLAPRPHCDNKLYLSMKGASGQNPPPAGETWNWICTYSFDYTE